MLNKLFGKKTYKLYLGNIHVVERKDLKRFFDQPLPLLFESNESLLYRRLEELFELPSAQNLKEVSRDDLAIDIIIPSYQGGSFMFGLVGVPVPLFWRPKLQILSQIYRLQDSKVLSKVKVTTKQPWRQFFKNLIPFQQFDSDELEPLLLMSCAKALEQHSKKLDIH
ncbi:MAG: hypothetical protein ACR2PX_14255 [Endozoicomonas sp.]|uniref:hypothetical protein n=1 Tax=Endozoicomonas sp. TaxID=1892382 RepID=UPI003D9BA437